MSVKGSIARLVESLPAGRQLVEGARDRRRQRDWSTLHRARFGKTSFSVFTTIGIGDVMVAKQLCTTFVRHCEVGGDPRLGNIVITAGAWPTSFRMEKGDHNIYWWWSMNGQDDWLDTYTAKASVKPDVIACPSEWCIRYAQERGWKTVYLPLAVGEYFQASNSGREGIGFAGSRGHKDEAQVEAILGPFRDRPDFEWVDKLKTPQDLNAFYNRKRIILGMTEKYQEKTGMVNNRVFEALATGTPFIIHRHRALEQVLECPYPYQSGSAEETRMLADEILEDYPKHQAAFERYRQMVHSRHTYRHRMQTLLEYLQARR